MGVALGRADLGVAEEAADHFRRGAARNQQRGEGVPQVVDADVGDLGDLLHLGPEALGIADRLIGDVAREQERAAFGHDFPAEADKSYGLVRDRHAVDAALLGTGSLLGPDRQIEVEMVQGGDRSPARAQTAWFYLRKRLLKSRSRF